MSGSAVPEPSGVGTAFSGSMNDPNCATSLFCSGAIDDELSTMNKTSSLLTSDAVKVWLPTRDGSGVGATNELALHAQMSGNPAPISAQRKRDHTRRAYAP